MSCIVRAFTKRQTVYAQLYEAEEYDRKWPPTDLLNFLQWIHEILVQIPIDARDTARIIISAVEKTDGPCAHMRVSYYRQETDEEMEDRAGKDRERRQEEERRERDLLAKLQAKYGS